MAYIVMAVAYIYSYGLHSYGNKVLQNAVVGSTLLHEQAPVSLLQVAGQGRHGQDGRDEEDEVVLRDHRPSAPSLKGAWAQKDPPSELSWR